MNCSPHSKRSEPRILGALLDAVSAALRNYRQGEARSPAAHGRLCEMDHRRRAGLGLGAGRIPRRLRREPPRRDRSAHLRPTPWQWRSGTMSPLELSRGLDRHRHRVARRAQRHASAKACASRAYGPDTRTATRQPDRSRSAAAAQQGLCGRAPTQRPAHHHHRAAEEAG